MVKLAQDVNRKIIMEQRLEIREAEAGRLPFNDGVFTCATMTNVFGFISDPVEVLTKIRRVLKENGRLVVFTGSSKLRGTIAAPEPIASRIHFYEDQELVHLARKAGFSGVRVERPDLSEYARAAGVPSEHVGSFKGREGQLLIAHKTQA